MKHACTGGSLTIHRNLQSAAGPGEPSGFIDRLTREARLSLADKWVSAIVFRTQTPEQQC